VRADADRVDVAKLVDLQSPQYRKVEEVDFPIDEVDHDGEIEHRLAVCDILEVRRRPDNRVVGIDHTARSRHPP